MPRPPVFLPRAEVERRVGLGRSAIYKPIKEGTFPCAIPDLDTASGWWLKSEIEAWQQQRIASRGIDKRGMSTSMGDKAKAPDFSYESGACAYTWRREWDSNPRKV
ncbi:MAG: AlpA family phage regulatory protein [Gammaproteobacteria bacterium]|uniref:helix-turn-helix transcriptional regulator n=1 Tax=Pseudomonas sp. Hp2 TaxID=701189 RepID=UPI0011277131|nr:AlpA family phage regulatory protein [Pseudomonas sp. Hp2]